jgi:hypothetical protein
MIEAADGCFRKKGPARGFPDESSLNRHGTVPSWRPWLVEPWGPEGIGGLETGVPKE